MPIKHSKAEQVSWKTIVANYHFSEFTKSMWQFINSFIPFVFTWILMYLSLDVSYWLTLTLALPASGFIMRIFIIQHDCGHGSFFESRKANDALGMFCSIFTLTPYHYWRKSHALHHANVGKTERRGAGDFYTLTVSEYLQRNKLGRLKYRLYRNPFILFLILPSVLFLFLYRFPFFSKTGILKSLHSTVYITNLVIAALAGTIIFLIGLKSFLLVQAPIIAISLSAGTWFFYVQHQFEDTYWDNDDQWDYTEAALRGSSYYKLPKILQWFTGNIGFHHIHHLSPRVPNYNLEKCHKENPLFEKTTILTLRSSLRSIFLTLWDEDSKKLISFRQLKN